MNVLNFDNRPKMTGMALKQVIFRYLEDHGWVHRFPGRYYAWDPPDNPRSQIDGRTIPQHFCWHAALLVQMAKEGAEKKPPAG